MRIFLAGAGGAIGRRLTPLLCAAGHDVVGTTRAPDKVAALSALGAEPVVVDIFDATALTHAVQAAAPQVVMHQLTDLPHAPGTPGYEAGLERNARLRIEGSRNLVAATKAAGVRRLIAQSIAFAYAPGDGMRVESDPLNFAAEGTGGRTVAAVDALEQAVLTMPEGIVLRYGFFYGPGTWSADTPARKPAVHIDAAAHAALLAISKGRPGIYNVAEDAPVLSSEKAKRELGFDAAFRLRLR
jgi:nucleoside-diphosphate-sugar epimerase